MVKLDSYIGKSVFMAILAVLGIILGLASLFAFIDEMGDISDSYTLLDAGSFVLLTAPRRLYDMLPMAGLIGCLIGLGSLASNSELTIMRAAGVSIGRIVWAVMKPMLVLMLAGVLIGEYLAPVTENKAQADRSLAQGGGEAQSSKRGLWHRQGEEFVHINTVQPNGLLLGVTRYHFDNERHLLSSSFSRKAQYQEDHWQLSDVTTTMFRGDHTEVVKSAEERWDVALTPQLLNTVVLAPESLSITGLWDYIHYLSDQGLNNDRYWLAFWTKVLQPLVTAALVLMAISFIFGPLRSVTLGSGCSLACWWASCSASPRICWDRRARSLASRRCWRCCYLLGSVRWPACGCCVEQVDDGASGKEGSSRIVGGDGVGVGFV